MDSEEVVAKPLNGGGLFTGPPFLLREILLEDSTLKTKFLIFWRNSKSNRRKGVCECGKLSVSLLCVVKFSIFQQELHRVAEN